MKRFAMLLSAVQSLVMATEVGAQAPSAVSMKVSPVLLESFMRSRTIAEGNLV